MTQALNISFRPKTFDDLIGQEDVVEKIREHIKSGRVPSAWLLSGASGVGKTTIARILALSLQCSHQKVFGHPCKDCRKDKSQFDIIEINTAEASGVDETESVISGAFYSPKPPSKYRIYIFDEMQKASNASQNVLLKYFEDSPETTIWVICTTEPGKIIRTLRRRCITYTIPELDDEGVKRLVVKAIEFTGSSMKSKPLYQALSEANVGSPGFIVMAVEKYLAGESPKRAARVGMETSLDTLSICRSVLRGDWNTVRQIMRKSTPDDGRIVRIAVSGYLKAVLLGSEAGSKADTLAKGLHELSSISVFEESLQNSATVAILYKLCQRFGE